jgi:hypothetical protein
VYTEVQRSYRKLILLTHVTWNMYIVVYYGVIADDVFALDSGFIDHLYTRLGTTSTRNYSTIANLHNPQITTAPSKSFPACCFHQAFPGNGF